MKKFLSFLLIVSLVSAMFTLWASADVEQPAFYCEDTTAAPGDEFFISISIAQNPGFNYALLEIALGEGLEFVSEYDEDEDEYLPVGDIAEDTAVTGIDSLTLNLRADGSVRALLEAKAKKHISGDGALIQLKVKAAADAKGDIAVTVTVKDGPYDKDEAAVEIGTVEGTVKIEAATPAYSLLGVSYDSLYYDATLLKEGSVDKWIHGLEDPSVLDFQVGTVSTITVRGWVKISTNAADIVNFGYSIDGGEVVTDTAFIEDRAAALASVGEQYVGAQGFNVVVPVATLAAGEHSIDTYVVAEDGTQIMIVKDRSTPEGGEDIRQVGVTFNVTEEEQPPMPASLHGMSFNTVRVDGNVICDVGDALGYLAEHPITGDVQNIGIRGWAWVDNSTIEAFGYKLDGGEPVFDAAYTEDRPDVYAQSGATQATANGFNINPVDVSALETGDHTITALVKAADGTIIEIVTAPFSIERAPAPEAPKLIMCWSDIFQLNGTFLTAAGWAGANYPANNLGYRIDGGEPDYDFIDFRNFNSADEEAIIKANAGEYAFRYATRGDGIDLSALAEGEHTITLVVRVTGPDGNAAVDMYSGTVTITKEVPPASLRTQSFNTVWVDGNVICDVGDALGYLAENPITGDVQTIGVRGWAWINNSTIVAFGYKLDGGEPVFDAAFLQDRPDVYAQSGATQATANGYTINPVDVSALETGDHTITVLVEAADGTIIEVVTAPFSVERPAPQDPVALHGYSFDTLWLDYNLMVDGGAGAWIEANPNFGFISLVSVRGWAWIDNGTIESFGYSIDDGEPVFDAANIQDRPDVQAYFGVSADVCNGFFINPIVVGGLSAGDHMIRLYVKATDGSVVEITSFSFTLEKAIWLCDAASGITIPGAWMTDTTHYIDVDFDSPVAFKGFCAMFYSNPEGIEAEIRLIDENGNVLETIPYTFAGDTAPTFFFSQAYPAGHYKIQVQPTAINPNPDAGFGWLVLGTSLPLEGGVPVTLSGNCTIQDPAAYNVENPDANKAPVMFLIEGIAPEAPEYALLNVSYDELKYDDTQLFSGSVDKSIFALEDKSVLDFEEGTINNITVRGWVRISENAADIVGFGYSIDGGEVVTGEFIEDRADAAAAYPGAVGFNVVVPVADLTAGEHSIDVYLIAADGTQIKVVKDRSTADGGEDIRQVGVTFNVTESAVIPTPTSDIAVIALAAVACVAAAGVVIGKKRLGK